MPKQPNKNDIYITFDYEMFLGNKSGGVQDCLIKPTKLLSEMLVRNKVNATFYVDFAYLITLQNKNDELIILNQLKGLLKNGNSIQLHIHPHWFNEKESNKFYVSEYNLTEIEDFINQTVVYAKEKLGISFKSYRTGSLDFKTLCLYEKFLYSKGIVSDSSSLDKNPLELKHLKQYKITTIYYSPFFYYKLIYHRYFQKLTKFNRFGKGNSKPMSFIQKLKRLLTGTIDSVSFDSNKWTLVYMEVIKKDNFVILNHPKCMNDESIEALDKFIKINLLSNSFKTLN